MKNMVKNQITSVFLVYSLFAGTFMLPVLTNAQEIDPLKVYTRSSAQNVTQSTASSLDGLIYRTNSQNIGAGESKIAFLAGLGNLSASSVYFYRAVVKNSNGIYYGSTESFKTKALAKTSTSGGSSSGGIFSGFLKPKSTAGSGSALMAVSISTDKTKVTQGEVFVYNVSYKNIGGTNADNVVLTVELPDDIDVEIAAPYCYLNKKDSLVFKIGRLASGESGVMGIRVKVSPTAKIGEKLTANVILEYSYSDSKYKATDSLDVVVKAEEIQGITAGTGFLSGGVLFWLILNIFLLTFLVFYVYYTRKRIVEMLKVDSTSEC
jgi:uncharacterized repeat protein (TIGR01451 family)